MEHTSTIPTKYGPVTVTIQDHDTAYVRVGTADRQSGASVPSDTTEPLQLPRGATITGRAHFTLSDGVWRTRQPFWRRDGQPFNDPTPTMVKLTNEAVAAALAEHVDTTALESAGVAKAMADARERRATAAKLRETAAALEMEADALENGGTVVYMENRYTSGASDRTRHVRTTSGELLDAVPAPPRVYGACEYPNHQPRERREVD